MSYDISFRVPVAGTDKFVETKGSDANITWNVSEIIRKSTGLPWINEDNNGLCVDVIPKIQAGLSELLVNGKEYFQYEPSNGWGSVSGVIRFFTQIIADWNDYIRWEDPEVVAVTTFWVI